jgi:uncharacterized protein YdeI (YjbR/CyaY-like superfamily)
VSGSARADTGSRDAKPVASVPPGPPQLRFADRAQWRGWLERHHGDTAAVWLVFAKKGSGILSVGYEEAVEEALCFGWIDSKVRRLDADCYQQYYPPRRIGSVWSRPNKERVARVTAAGLMTAWGSAKVEAAQRDGSWDLLDQIDRMVVPSDLEAALAVTSGATAGFKNLPDTAIKGILWWIATAKRPATRSRRISEIAIAAAQGVSPLPRLT